MKKIKRRSSLLLALVLVLSMFPTTAVYADYSHSLDTGGTGTGTYTPAHLGPTIDNHKLNGSDVFCLDPYTTYGSSYTTGTDRGTADINFGNAVTYAAMYSDGYPNVSGLTHQVSSEVTRKIGAQMAIFNETKLGNDWEWPYKIFGYNAEQSCYLQAMNNCFDTNIFSYYDSLEQYREGSSPSLAKPSFDGLAVQLSYDANTNCYTGSITDMNNVLGNYNFNALGDGITYSVSGNTLYISAPAATFEARCTGSYNGMPAYTTGQVYGATQNTYISYQLYNGTGSYVQPLLSARKVTGNASNTTSLTLYGSAPKGNLRITKTSSDNNNSGLLFRVVGNGIDTVVTTNNAGVADLNNIPTGEYSITEVNTPNKYIASAVPNVVVSQGQTAQANAFNTLKSMTVAVQKYDADLQTELTHGNASVDGAVYGLYSDQVCTNLIAQGTIMGGQTNFANLNCGVTYYLKEITPPTGYRADPTVYELLVSFDSATEAVTSFTKTVYEQIQRGGVKIQKVDANTNTATAQGNGSMANAVFSVVNRSTNAVFVNGQRYNPGEVCCRLTTNEAGFAESGNILPYGSYEIYESVPPTGYTLNTTWNRQFTITTDGEVFDYTAAEHQVPETVIHADVELTKYDAESMTAGSGAAKVAGTTFEIKNASANAVIVNGVSYNPGETVTTLTVDDNGYARTNGNLLPFGTYDIVEVGVGAGYLLNPNLSIRFNIEQDGATVSLNNPQTGASNEVIRGDVSLTKFYKTNPLANVVFRVTSQTTGESHILVTDANGQINTSVHPHGVNTNANDAAVDSAGIVNEAMLNPNAGVWFYGNANLQGNVTERGAFPYDMYTFEEIKSTANESLEMVSFTVTVDSNNTVVNHGNVVNRRYGGDVEIATTLVDDKSGNHYSTADTTVLTDTVTLTGLIVGEEYTLRGILYDKSANAQFLVNGNPVTAEYTFTANDVNMVISELHFPLNNTDAVGRTLVAFEYLYYKGTQNTSHEDIDDQAQTVYFPAISSLATSTAGWKEICLFDRSNMRHDSDDSEIDVDLQQENDRIDVLPKSSAPDVDITLDYNELPRVKANVEYVTINDLVTYRGLQPGTTYKFTTQLIDKATGAVIPLDGGQTSKTESFVPRNSDGSLLITFTVFPEDVSGKTAVVYERLLNSAGELITAHEDINDTEQTVYFPSISTYAASETTDKHIPEAEASPFADRIYLDGLTPGKQYSVKGTAYNGTTMEPLTDAQGVPVTSQMTITYNPDTEFYVLPYTVDATGITGGIVHLKTVITNENDVVVAVDDNEVPSDEFVYIPSVKTVATGADGNHELKADGNTVEVTDKVDLTNLIRGYTYTVKGKIVKQNDVDTVVAEAETTFTAEADGDTSVNLKFTIDTRKYKEGAFVVFETLYYKDVIIASHEEPTDEDQTVYIPRIRTVAKESNGTKALAAVADKVVEDVVYYAGLIPGAEYKLTAILVDKETGVQAVGIGSTVVTQTFTADATGSGAASVFFNGIDLSKSAEKRYVVFETLTKDDREIAKHADPSDAQQTVYVSSLATYATAKSESSPTDTKEVTFASLSEKITVTDTVEYTNLYVGVPYVINGILMDKATGAPVQDADGENITATINITPDNSNGKATMTFEVLAKDVAGKEIVVFETLMKSNEIIAEHKDIDDEAQTVIIGTIIEFTKIDGTTKKGVAGVKFLVTNKADNSTFHVTTDTNGKAMFGTQKGCEYTLVEAEVPEGYEKTSTVYELKIDKDGKVTGDTTIVNWLIGTVVITKVDSANNKPLEGAMISIYRKDAAGDKVVFSQATDKHGRIYFYPETAGDYYFVETAAPKNYYLDSERHAFTVKEDFSVSGSTTFTNSKLGTVVIKKTSTTGAMLSGATISVYNAATNARVGTGKTDENGRIYFISPGPGSYYFVENEAPNGYVLDTTQHAFTISSNFQVTGTTSMQNQASTAPATGDNDELNVWKLVTAISTSIFVLSVFAYIYCFRKAKNAVKP